MHVYMHPQGDIVRAAVRELGPAALRFASPRLRKHPEFAASAASVQWIHWKVDRCWFMTIMMMDFFIYAFL
jgi:hypothetical protein